MPSATIDREAAIKRTGELMLTGYKMLSTMCPICTSVLLQKGNQCHCPGCNMDVMFEQEARESGRFTGLPPPPQVAATVRVPAPAPEEEEEEEYELAEEPQGFSSLEDMKREYDKTNKVREAISAKLGERMLSGGIMLSRVCENPACASTPLMCKASDRTLMECVACSTSWVESCSGALVASKVAANAATAAAQPKAKPAILAQVPVLPPAPAPAPAPASSIASPSAAQAAQDAQFSRLCQSDAPVLNLFQRSDPNGMCRGRC